MFWFYIFLSFPAGALLGGFFFGGLWWTVNKITGSDSPYIISAVSFLLRTAVVLVGFYFLLQAGWQFLVVALFGFIAARTVLAYKLKPHSREGRGDHHK